jgi:hypothetical protein
MQAKKRDIPFLCQLHKSGECRPSLDAPQRETSESDLKTLPINIMQAKKRNIPFLREKFLSRNPNFGQVLDLAKIRFKKASPLLMAIYLNMYII